MTNVMQRLFLRPFVQRFGRGLFCASLGALALAAPASAQGYGQGYGQPYPLPPGNIPAPNSPPPGQGQQYPAQQYPAQQYPAQQYPAQQYPARQYPAQQYPAQPAQQYPPQQYPGQRYPAANYPPQGAPSQGAPSQGAPSQGAPGQANASPVCVRLEADLASLNGSNGSAARQAQIQQAEQAIARQQAGLDRMVAQARRAGCGGGGFLSLFSGFSPSCAPLNAKIDKARGDLDNQMSSLEQLKSGGNDQDSQHAALIGQLAQNNCGPQYTQAARAAGPQGFFEALLGNGTVVNPSGNGAPAGTYRTICVRSCDGAYFPISYSTVPARFGADAQSCQRLCPGAQATLYTYRNPGESTQQAVSITGAPYTALPNAFRFRKEVVAGCSCRKPGESWAQALRNADDPSTLERGDIVVTDQNEKALTRIPGSAVPRPQPPPASAPSAAAGAPDTVVTDSKNRKVRVVGPPSL